MGRALLVGKVGFRRQSLDKVRHRPGTDLAALRGGLEINCYSASTYSAFSRPPSSPTWRPWLAALNCTISERLPRKLGRMSERYLPGGNTRRPAVVVRMLYRVPPPVM